MIVWVSDCDSGVSVIVGWMAVIVWVSDCDSVGECDSVVE